MPERRIVGVVNAATSAVIVIDPRIAARRAALRRVRRRCQRVDRHLNVDDVLGVQPGNRRGPDVVDADARCPHAVFSRATIRRA